MTIDTQAIFVSASPLFDVNETNKIIHMLYSKDMEMVDLAYTIISGKLNKHNDKGKEEEFTDS